LFISFCFFLSFFSFILFKFWLFVGLTDRSFKMWQRYLKSQHVLILRQWRRSGPRKTVSTRRSRRSGIATLSLRTHTWVS
jgi:hypothetical protein